MRTNVSSSWRTLDDYGYCLGIYKINFLISLLQMDNVTVCGKIGVLHFIRFPTAEMSNFLELAKKKGMAKLVTTVCATGGGAFKFEDAFRRVNIGSRSRCVVQEN